MAPGVSLLSAWISAWVVLSPLAAGGALAQAPGRIADIRVEGTQRIDPQTVLSYMPVKPGDPFDARASDQSLKELFKTGLFADVVLRREGNSLVVAVVENPIVNRIAFEGASRVKPEVLESEVSLRPRIVFTRAKVQADVNRIMEIYRQAGRFAAQVEPKIIRLPENRVDLVFEIAEGPSTGIRAIRFIGNRIFSDNTLRKEIQTVESAFWRIFTQDDTYDPDRVAFDRELLRRFYLSRGYADFRVVSAVAELMPDQEDFLLTFTLEEGAQYTFSDIRVTTELSDLDVDALRDSLGSRSGEIYNADLVERAVQSLTEVVGERGFAFAEVQPRVSRDRETRTVSVDYHIAEGPRVAVERIDITGNLRTVDRVIRRELQLVEGDAFNAAKVRRSRQKLQNLGFFGRVDLSNEPGSAEDRTVVNVDVEEKSTGALSLGAGFSTTSGALADISIRERNLLGRGHDLRVGLTAAAKQQQVDLSFTEPYFMDREVSVGFDIFHRRVDRSRENSLREDETGVGIRSGFDLSPNLRQTVGYTFKRDKIGNVPATASRVSKQQQGTSYISTVSTGVFYDRLDTRFNPSDGYFARYDADIAGLGGQVRYVRNKIAGGIFIPVIGDDTIFGLDGEIAYITGIGKGGAVRLADRFYMGGDNLRGFRTAGAGPRDVKSSNKDALGGKLRATGTVELRFPLGLPRELGVTGSVFSDFGLLTGIDEKGAGFTDTGKPRASVGVGIAWRSPFGPIRVDLARQVLKQDFDKREALRLNFSTGF